MIAGSPSLSQVLQEVHYQQDQVLEYCIPLPVNSDHSLHQMDLLICYQNGRT